MSAQKPRKKYRRFSNSYPLRVLPLRRGRVLIARNNCPLFRKEGRAQRREFEHTIVGTRHAVSAKKVNLLALYALLGFI